ncbi:MAG: aspartate kinase [Bacilli bacterium]
MNKIKVCKFGGTSMATAAAIRQVRTIIESDSERQFIIVSAPGKRFSGDVKVTDLLNVVAEEIISYHHAKSYHLVEERFIEIVNELNLDIDIRALLAQTLATMLENETYEFIVSRGEYLSAYILAKYLDYTFIDATELVRFRTSKLDYNLTNKVARKRLKEEKSAVIPGFYGLNSRGDIKLLTRGGSDVTGALVARALRAHVYENWTDTDGFLMCDPRIVEQPKLIEAMSYKELRSLSFMGASILHSDTFYPVSKLNIPINTRNTFNPTCAGTFIYGSVPLSKSREVITGIAGLKNFTLVVLEKQLMNEIQGFDRKVLSICEKLDINVEHFPSGTDTFSLMIESKYLQGDKKETLINNLRKTMRPDTIEVIDNISLISVVGRNLMANKYNMLRLFSALVNTNITLRMIDFGSSGSTNIVIGVDDIDYAYAINAVYNEFVKGERNLI